MRGLKSDSIIWYHFINVNTVYRLASLGIRLLSLSSGWFVRTCSNPLCSFAWWIANSCKMPFTRTVIAQDLDCRPYSPSSAFGLSTQTRCSCTSPLVQEYPWDFHQGSCSDPKGHTYRNTWEGYKYDFDMVCKVKNKKTTYTLLS